MRKPRAVTTHTHTHTHTHTTERQVAATHRHVVRDLRAATLSGRLHQARLQVVQRRQHRSKEGGGRGVVVGARVGAHLGKPGTRAHACQWGGGLVHKRPGELSTSSHTCTPVGIALPSTVAPGIKAANSVPAAFWIMPSKGEGPGAATHEHTNRHEQIGTSHFHQLASNFEGRQDWD